MWPRAAAVHAPPGTGFPMLCLDYMRMLWGICRQSARICRPGLSKLGPSILCAITAVALLLVDANVAPFLLEMIATDNMSHSTATHFPVAERLLAILTLHCSQTVARRKAGTCCLVKVIRPGCTSAFMQHSTALHFSRAWTSIVPSIVITNAGIQSVCSASAQLVAYFR